MTTKNKNDFYEDLYKDDENIDELKYKDFTLKDKKLKLNNKEFENNKSLIIFYATWCGHCKTICDDIKELSITNLNKFKIGVVNISDNKNKNYLLSDFLKIDSIPSAYIIENNHLVKLNKSVNFDNLFFYINMNI